MLQSEVGSAKLNPAHSFSARGRLMCDFTLPSAEGGQVSLYDYRGHANLVLFFAGDAADLRENGFLRTLVQRYAEIRGQDSEILVVLACSRSKRNGPSTRCNCRFPFWLTKTCKSTNRLGQSTSTQFLLPRFT